MKHPVFVIWEFGWCGRRLVEKVDPEADQTKNVPSGKISNVRTKH